MAFNGDPIARLVSNQQDNFIQLDIIKTNLKKLNKAMRTEDHFKTKETHQKLLTYGNKVPAEYFTKYDGIKATFVEARDYVGQHFPNLLEISQEKDEAKAVNKQKEDPNDIPPTVDQSPPLHSQVTSQLGELHGNTTFRESTNAALHDPINLNDSDNAALNGNFGLIDFHFPNPIGVNPSNHPSTRNQSHPEDKIII